MVEKMIDYDYVGVDEVGRGSLAGPIVAGAVNLGYDHGIKNLKDSKKFKNESKREEKAEEIKEQAVEVNIGSVSAKMIDNINIRKANHEAMRSAVMGLEKEFNGIIVDGDMRIEGFDDIPQSVKPEADNRFVNVMAASIVAKVYRDNLMREWHKKFPEYNWKNNKGYGSEEHLKAIEKHGITPIHRKTFLSKKSRRRKGLL